MPKPIGTKRPAKGKGIAGPAKGAGNGNPQKKFTQENAREMSRKGIEALAEKRERDRIARAEWHAAHPEYGGLSLSPKQVREYILSGLPPVIDKAFEIAHDDEHPRQMDAIKMLQEQAGKPPQEVTGKDGAPLTLEHYVMQSLKPKDE